MLKMKPGFYVSPCGKYIIEIKVYKGRVCESIDVDFERSHIKFDGWNLMRQLKILLSGWERLDDH
jgi:hypothetical protein